jgi:hypothetical protein
MNAITASRHVALEEHAMPADEDPREDTDRAGELRELRSDVRHLQSDVTDLKTEVRALRDKVEQNTTDLRKDIMRIGESLASAKIWAMALYFALAGSMLYVMARGFKWL